MITTSGLTHIQLYVKNIRLSMQFYEIVFGMQERFWDGQKMVFLSTPGTRDLIALYEDDSQAGVMGGVEHFGFRIEDDESLDAALATVEAAGGGIDSVGEHGGQPYAVISDLDGYLIELYFQRAQHGHQSPT